MPWKVSGEISESILNHVWWVHLGVLKRLTQIIDSGGILPRFESMKIIVGDTEACGIRRSEGGIVALVVLKRDRGWYEQLIVKMLFHLKM